jgi:diguanylate cyclase (GGDEF)-like protein/PAS domain S-box-containing protein
LSADVYWEQDSQYRFTVVTGGGPAWLEVERQQVGTRCWDHAYLNMTPAAWATHIADLDARRPFRDLHLSRLDKTGRQVWLSTSGDPTFDAAGAFTGYRGIGKDITGRKREEKLLALEHAVNRGIAESDGVAAALQMVMRAICESEGWECCRCYLVDETADTLPLAGAWHVPEPAFARFVEVSRIAPIVRGKGLVGCVWESGEPLWSTDLANDPRALKRSHSLDTDLRAALDFPVIAEGRTIGVLAFSTRQAREPDQRLLRAVHAIGTQIGQFLQRKRAEAVLRESEARFRSLTSLSSDWYWEQDEEYRFVDMTLEIDTRTGVSALAHIGKRRWELAAPNMTEVDWAAHRAVVEAHQPFRDLQLCRAAEDGSLRWVTISGEPIFDAEGRCTGYRGIGKDITARKREEKLLALEHAVTRSLAEAESASIALKAVIRAICESEGWECGRYSRVDEAARVMRFTEYWGKPDPMIDRFIDGKREVVYGPGDGLSGKVWQSGKPLWSTDTIGDERGLGSAVNAETGMHGAFVFPVTAEGSTIGVLTFNSREIRDPNERLLRAVHAIGSQIGQFLRRKEGEEALRNHASQQRLIAEFGQQAFANTALAEVLPRAAQLAADTLKTDYSSVLELAPEGSHLVFKAAFGWPAEWVGQRTVAVVPGSRLDGILTRGEARIIEDYAAESDISPSPLLQFGIHSGVQVPIFGTREAYGLLTVHTRQARRFMEDEVVFLRSIANILATAIERKNADDRLSHLARFDTVTGLPNRHLFRDRLEQMLTLAARNRWLIGVLFIDLDRFKAVNDTYGHGAGDKVLGQTASRLKECVRSGDTVGRLSGDEFAIALSNLAQADDAGLVAQKIVKVLTAAFEFDGIQAYVTASIGIALYPEDGGDPDVLLKNADTAMYRAKEQGRNNYQFYLPQMNERLMQRLQLDAQLRGALERNEFLLHYQPKVSLRTGAITGFEALLRWQPGDLMVSPAEFIPILEDTGAIVPVGEWVLRTVCEQIRQWGREGLAVRPVAVNLSARQFQRRNLAAVVAETLRDTGVAPELIELELTETLLMGDVEEAVETLRQLKSLGVGLSVDDFGTGYSSLSYLKRFPLDALKIDRTFIRDAVSNLDDAAITATIINLAHSLKLKVVAEGVETEEQLQFLRSHDCDEMQGFYFARPLNVTDCAKALAEDRRLESGRQTIVANPPSLLLVDDNAADLLLLKHALAAEGFRILTAAGARAALEVLARDGADIVITDQLMPEMTGVEFLNKVRKLYPGTVRIVVSGHDDRRTLVEAINSAGIHKFLSKNWAPNRMCAEVREAYDARR